MRVCAHAYVVVFTVSEALPDAAVSACSITVGSDRQAHYLFIGSSRHGDCGNRTERRGSGGAVSPHTVQQAVSQRSRGALRVQYTVTRGC